MQTKRIWSSEYIFKHMSYGLPDIKEFSDKQWGKWKEIEIVIIDKEEFDEIKDKRIWAVIKTNEIDIEDDKLEPLKAQKGFLCKEKPYLTTLKWI